MVVKLIYYVTSERMKKIIQKICLTLTYTSLICSCNHRKTIDSKGPLVNQSNIVGGNPTLASDFEAVVALTNEFEEIFCSGVAVMTDRILTAGHCVLDLEELNSTNLNLFISDSHIFGAKFLIDAYKYIDDLSTQKEKKDALDELLVAYLKYRSKKILVKVSGSKVLTTVQNVSISSDWKKLLQYILYIEFAILKDDELLNDDDWYDLQLKADDKAELSLTENLLLSPVKIYSGNLKPGTKVRVVGLGDRANLPPKEKIEETFFSDQDFPTIPTGVKYYTDLEVNSAFKDAKHLVVLSSKLNRGACSGDSGGGAFTYNLQTKSWDLAGILIMSAERCGEVETFGLDNSRSIVKGTTLITRP